MRLEIRGGGRLRGQAEVPPDKSILHRALILGALGTGTSRIHPLGQGADNRSTLEALRQLGVRIDVDGDTAVVHGVGGPRALRPPSDVVDCGNSGTTMRFLTGVCAGIPNGETRFDGDASLRRRPMGRLAPLEAMGAELLGRTREGKLTPPFGVRGAELEGTHHELEVASAQLKSALLLAGAFGKGRTTVVEPKTSRDHTERMLRARGVALGERQHADGRNEVSVDGPVTWTNIDAAVPPDASSAAFLAGAVAVAGGRVRVRTGVNPTRTGGLDALEGMGLSLRREGNEDWAGEPTAELMAEHTGALQGVEISGELTLRAIDELPLLAAVAAVAEGPTTIRDAEELRVKESDRIEAMTAALVSFGVEVASRPDGMVVTGGRPLHPGRVEPDGDHRIAMAGAVLALGVEGLSVIEDAEVIQVSFPGFLDTLRALGADVRAV